MNNVLKMAALAAGALALTASSGAQAQNSEVDQLRRDYDQRMRVMQQAFEERLAAIEAKQAEAVAAPAASSEGGEPNEFKWYWKEGLRFDTYDGAFKLKFNGRIQLDNAFYDADSDVTDVTGEDAWDDGVEFRRTRLEVAGDIYDDIQFKIQYDWAGDGTADFKDVYMGMKTDVGTFRVGHFKEPFSLDELTSSKDIQFMERALPNIFAPSRNTGLAYMNSFAEDRVTFAAGIFREANDFGDSENEEEIAFTGRLTGLPYTNEDHTRMIHLGAAASVRSADDDSSSLRFRQRPETHVSDARLVDTGSIAGLEDTTLFGLELAGVYDRFAMQAEYINADVDFDDAVSGGIDNAGFDGYYAQASFFLTDDSRNYKASDGIFDKVKPNTPFSLSNPGMGAWEVLARYSSLDLNDESEGVVGGEVDSITLALNWYLNANVRVGLNYVNADADDGPIEGDVDVIQTRFQVTW